MTDNLKSVAVAMAMAGSDFFEFETAAAVAATMNRRLADAYKVKKFTLLLISGNT